MFIHIKYSYRLHSAFLQLLNLILSGYYESYWRLWHSGYFLVFAVAVDKQLNLYWFDFLPRGEEVASKHLFGLQVSVAVAQLAVAIICALQ